MLQPFGRECVWKAIPVAKLISLLGELPDAAWITTNEVDNLVVFNGKGEQLGYIDLANEGHELFDDE